MSSLAGSRTGLLTSGSQPAPSAASSLSISTRGTTETGRLADLERGNGPLPDTWRFLTGGDGEHILFRHPGPSGRGIDLRGDGGYIVAPPSRHICGRTYAISVGHHPDHVGLANAPAWLLELVYRRADDRGLVRSSPQKWRAAIGRTITEGERNSTLTSFAGALLRSQVDPYLALYLLHAWNAAHCRPPLPDAEVTATVRSIARREIERREGRQNG
jgi:Bifunctional DNA primase/polymerase, N-terminal/Primase C terminal 1 (PriCT-1)